MKTFAPGSVLAVEFDFVMLIEKYFTKSIEHWFNPPTYIYIGSVGKKKGIIIFQPRIHQPRGQRRNFGAQKDCIV